MGAFLHSLARQKLRPPFPFRFGVGAVAPSARRPLGNLSVFRFGVGAGVGVWRGGQPVLFLPEFVLLFLHLEIVFDLLQVDIVVAERSSFAFGVFFTAEVKRVYLLLLFWWAMQ